MTDVDIAQVGSGPIVTLVHSRVAGARQWRRLMGDQEDHFHLIAVNLFGYVSTPAWSGHLSQTLEGQARLVEAVVPEHKGKFSLIGDFFGGSVSMKAAAKFGSRIDNLILLDLNSMAKEKHSPRAWGYAIALRNADMPMNGQKQRINSLTIGAVQKLGPPCRTNVKPHSLKRCRRVMIQVYYLLLMICGWRVKFVTAWLLCSMEKSLNWGQQVYFLARRNMIIRRRF